MSNPFIDNNNHQNIINEKIIENNFCLGIDFGTTNSCLSVWYNNKSIIIQDIDGNETIPTVIEINSDKKIIGREAYLRKEIFTPNNNKNIFLVYEIKKLLGKKYSELNKKQIEILAYEIRSDDNDNILIIDSETLKSYYPEEIAAHLFMSFKLKAETFLSKKFNIPIIITNSVISVPAYFNKNQRNIIKSSAEYAGFNVLRLINEPTAAAICYGLGKTFYSKNNNGLNIIVFDFGGGTLDVSLLNINDGVYEVLGSCGNNNLGGSDFDNKIMEYVINEFINSNKNLNIINNSVNIDDFVDNFINNISENSLQKLKLLCEHAKISLSDNTNAKIKIINFYNNIDLNVNISRHKYNEIISNLVCLIIKPLNDVIELCNINKSEIDEIIMVGGMTRVPIIRYNIERYFNKDVNCSINPDNVVSIGASIHGYMLLNDKCIQDKLLLIDRTSLSIGIETSGGIMDVIIPRGSIIPIKKIKKYSTDADYIEYVNIKIYEGERKFTKDNFLIGDFILSGIEKQKKGIPSIQITFSVDSDGIIKIFAEDLDNPLNKKSIQVSGNKQNLNQEQINQIIENAKQMDKIDKIDKIKKESYISIYDNSLKILDVIDNDSIKIPDDIKYTITTNINEIFSWIKSTNYQDISIEKYNEIIHDYKINYSIYIIQQSNSNIIELDASNTENDKGIEIFDDDANTKKYEEQINYFRKIIDEYNIISKQLNIIKFMNINYTNSFIEFDDFEKLFNEVNNYASDNLLYFFIEKNLSDDIVNNITSKLHDLDVKFKELFNLFDEKFNVISNLLLKLQEKENYYLSLLDNLPDISNNINEKLDIILEFQTVIYKMNSGYIEPDIDKISNILSYIENMQ